MTGIGWTGYECPYNDEITHTTQERHYRFTPQGYCFVTFIEFEYNGDEIVSEHEEAYYLNYNRPRLPYEVMT